MSKPKIAVNGFGRIGRTITRIAKLRGHFDVVAVNDLSSPEDLAYAFRYDSIHGVYPGEVSFDGDRMEIDGDSFKVLSEKDPAKLPWAELGVDYVIESTGKFRRLAELNQHRGRQPVWLIPSQSDWLVRIMYEWGAVNCELHFAQIRGPWTPPIGIVMPTFMPETG